MSKKDRLFNYNESSFFNTFVHFGMIVKVLSAIAMMIALWYYL